MTEREDFDLFLLSFINIFLIFTIIIYYILYIHI